MQTHNTNLARVLLALLTQTLLTAAQDQAPPLRRSARDNAERAQEMARARVLLREKHDLSPIDDAFAAKDIWLLWHYYTNSFEISKMRFEGFRWSDELIQQLSEKKDERAEGARRARERYLKAGGYLKQLPGHARLLGDYIEERLHSRGEFITDFSTCFACLSSLGKEGSDECIEQLGRFLFDKRDPGFVSQDPAQLRTDLWDLRGVERPMQDKASGGLYTALKDRVPFVKGLERKDDPYGSSVPGYADKLRAWWLTNTEAAPYRRSLASTGVVLPPGYPPTKELEGTKTTIAPPLKNPPYPDDYPLPQGVKAKQ